MKPATHIAIGVLTLVALGHLIRLVLGIEVTAAGVVIPLWLSLFGVVIAGALAVGVWRETHA